MHTYSAIILMLAKDRERIDAILEKHGVMIDSAWVDDDQSPDVLTAQLVWADTGTRFNRMGIALAEVESVIGGDELEAVVKEWINRPDDFLQRCF